MSPWLLTSVFDAANVAEPFDWMLPDVLLMIGAVSFAFLSARIEPDVLSIAWLESRVTLAPSIPAVNPGTPAVVCNVELAVCALRIVSPVTDSVPLACMAPRVLSTVVPDTVTSLLPPIWPATFDTIPALRTVSTPSATSEPASFVTDAALTVAAPLDEIAPPALRNAPVVSVTPLPRT
ncbi:hypothetical protein BamIOP4010DRAFT_2591 [Burkholderia ambifaria IOP40-10]|uniref:Uncharacterized protein n=1 Tax=Burkholderia ambifaria IOP40-10 TaxID=396596 RepID=B1FEY1_9BURK|nr:hypothetical protein BamIOP4010DRAFT_2591 [Burkholderia ambifaria IOP40-10]